MFLDTGGFDHTCSHRAITKLLVHYIERLEAADVRGLLLPQNEMCLRTASTFALAPSDISSNSSPLRLGAGDLVAQAQMQARHRMLDSTPSSN